MMKGGQNKKMDRKTVVNILGFNSIDSGKNMYVWKEGEYYITSTNPFLAGRIVGFTNDLRDAMSGIEAVCRRGDYRINIGKRPDGTEAPLGYFAQRKVKRFLNKLDREQRS